MEQSNANTEAPEPQVVTRELVRPREGRMVAGVAQGLANRFDIPVVLIRVAFAILTFWGWARSGPVCRRVVSHQVRG